MLLSSTGMCSPAQTSTALNLPSASIASLRQDLEGRGREAHWNTCARPQHLRCPWLPWPMPWLVPATTGSSVDTWCACCYTFFRQYVVLERSYRTALFMKSQMSPMRGAAGDTDSYSPATEVADITTMMDLAGPWGYLLRPLVRLALDIGVLAATWIGGGTHRSYGPPSPHRASGWRSSARPR